MKKMFFICIFAAMSFGVLAQDFEVPEYNFTAREDYAKHNEQVLACADWLENNYPENDTEKLKRLNANLFILKWCEGTPDIRFEINPAILTFTKQTDYFVLFFSGWARYGISAGNTETNTDNYVAGMVAGLESVLNFYDKFKYKAGKNKKLEKYVKMRENGTLEEFVRENTAETPGR